MPTEFPGLVLDWKQTPDGWQALTIYVKPGGATHIEWFDSEHLRPILTSPRIGSAYG